MVISDIFKSLFRKKMSFEPDADAVISLIEQAGDLEYFDFAVSSAVSQYENNPIPLSKVNQSRLESILISCYEKETILQAAADVFLEQFNAEHYVNCQKFYHSDCYKRLAEQENYADSPIGEREYAHFCANIEKFSISPKREKLLNDILMKSGTFILHSHFIAAPYGAQIHISAKLSKEHRYREIDIGNYSLGWVKERVRLHQTSLFSYLIFMYRNVSDKELKKYLTFVTSKAGSWYINAIHLGILNGYDICFKKAMEAAENSPFEECIRLYETPLDGSAEYGFNGAAFKWYQN